MSIETTAKALAEKVLEMDKVCDKAKLEDIELEKLEVIVEYARMLTGDLSAYDQVTVVK